MQEATPGDKTRIEPTSREPSTPRTDEEIRTRLDEAREHFRGHYTLRANGVSQEVDAFPAYRISTSGSPTSTQARAKLDAALPPLRSPPQSREEMSARAEVRGQLGMVVSGKAPPEAIRQVTQALIEVGALTPFLSHDAHGETREVPAEEAIRRMQKQYGIGVDCSGFCYWATREVHGLGEETANDGQLGLGSPLNTLRPEGPTVPRGFPWHRAFTRSGSVVRARTRCSALWLGPRVMPPWMLAFGVGLAVWSACTRAHAQAATPDAVGGPARRAEPRSLDMPRTRLDQLLRESRRERSQRAGQQVLLLENQCLQRGSAKNLEVQFGKPEGDPLSAVLPRLSQEWVRMSSVGDARGLVLGLTGERASAQPGAVFITTPERLLYFELAQEGFPVLVDRDADTVVVLYQAWQSQRAQLAYVDWSGPKLTELLALPNLPGVPQELVTLDGRHYLQWGRVSGPGEVVRLAANGRVAARFRLASSGSRLFKAGGALYVVDQAQRNLLRLDADLNPMERWRIETGAAPRAEGLVHAP